jgi:hypothetical protein
VRRLLVLAFTTSAVIALIVTLGVSAHDRVTTAVTWDREIGPIVAAHCVACHSGRPGTTVSLATYEAARPWARAIRQQVLTRRMPVWRAARGYGEFANDASLSPFEITLITAWADGGAPKSTPEKPVARIIDAAPAQTPFMPPRSTREQTMGCDSRVAPTGIVLGLRPQLTTRGSVRVIATFPNGDRRILGWFRDVDPADQTVYWLQNPIELGAGVSILASGEPASGCALALTLR